MLAARHFPSHLRRLSLPGPVVLGALWAGLVLPGWTIEPESVKKPAEPKAIPRAAAGEKKAEPAPPTPPEPSAEEERSSLLEKLADNLSKRMRALADRERIAADREKALSDREAALKERESLLEARENVVRRREKLPPPQSWHGPKPPTVAGKYAAVIDGRTMQFYHEKDALERTPVASTQKIVTALVVCRENNLDEKITVPEDVLRVEPTVVGLKPGDAYTRRDLLHALLIRSGNDVAVTLAIGNAGSVEAFAEKMNAFARSLGMENSHFLNPHGLPAEGQYSCAHDMALAAFEAYQIPDIRDIVKLRTHSFTFADGTTRDLYNTNSVLSSNEHCNGMKTGFTYAAGHCLVASGTKAGQDRIVVMIKSHKPYVWSDSSKLLDWSLNLEIAPDDPPLTALP